MSTKHRKTILRVGTYHSPDGKVEVTPDRLRHWAEQTQALQSAGYAIPMHWDHSSDKDLLEPIAMSQLEEGKSRSAKNTVGRLESFQVSEDGNSAVITVQGLTAAAQEKMATNAVTVSPVIFPNWKDGANKSYADAITSIDLVNHPVDHSQEPFVAVEEGEPVCCAIRMGVTPDKVFRLALQADDANDDSQKSPAPPTDQITRVVTALSRVKIVLPDGTTPENILDRLETALLTVAAQSGEDEMEEAPKNKPPVVTETQPAIATMSLQAKQAVAYAERQHRETIGGKLSGLLDSGRCTPEEFKKLEQKVPAIKLSLNDAGEPEPSELEHFIASRAAVPAGTFWAPDERVKKMGLQEVKAPTSWAGNVQSQQEEDEMVKRQLERMGIK